LFIIDNVHIVQQKFSVCNIATRNFLCYTPRRRGVEGDRKRRWSGKGWKKRPGTWETARILRVPHALLSPGETGKRYLMVGFLLKLSLVFGIHQDEL